MHLSTLTLVAAAIVGTSATLNLTDAGFAGITVGTPFEITWGDATPPVELVLMEGFNELKLQTVTTLTTGLTGATGTYTWTPATSLTSADYAIFIQDAVTTNYGVLFQLLGGSAASTTATASSTTGTGSTTATTTSGSTSASNTGSSSTGSTTTGPSSTSSKTSSKTSSSTTSSSTSTTTAKVNSAAGISSPFAMVFLSFAAFAFLN